MVRSKLDGGSKDLQKRNWRLKVVWSPLPIGFFKLKFDGSKLSNGSTSFGFVIRNCEGEVCLSGAKSLDPMFSILWWKKLGDLGEGIRGDL